MAAMDEWQADDEDPAAEQETESAEPALSELPELAEEGPLDPAVVIGRDR
jgi:hypothetical protein